MSSVIGVTAGGIDVKSIVEGLMSVERQPVDRLVTRQSTIKLQSDAIGRLRNSFETLRSVASSLVSGGLSRYSSNVSNTGAIQATLSSSAAAGSISFTVDRLATASGLRTASTVASNSTVVTTASSLAVSTTTTALGIGAASVGAGVVNGKYTLTVTQASAGASQTGGAAPLWPVAGGTLDLVVNGQPKQLALTGPYTTPAALVSALQTQLGADGTASLDAAGRLKITTAREGSLSSLEVTGGTAMTDLGFAPAGVSNGTNGTVRIGSNPPATVSSTAPGSSVAVDTGSGMLTFAMGGGLRVGSATVAVVSTGDRSLAAVAAAINGANVGASASAVKVSDGNWLLQLNSRTPGSNGALKLDASVFAGLGGLVETSVAQDAQISVGSGPGKYSITSSSNVFKDVMSGVTLTATAESTVPVTVSVSRDDNASAAAVEKFVGQVTSMLADIALQTRYDAATKKKSPLTSDAGVRSLATDIRAAVTSMVGSIGGGLASSAGITVERTGTLKFDRDKFMTALNADPAMMERLFGRGGTTSGSATFSSATDATIAGAYPVVITTAPTRATLVTPIDANAVAGKRIGVRIGTLTATYDVALGATDSQVAAGLNASLAAAGLKINAEATAGGVVLTASDFGATGSFESNLDVAGIGAWLPGTVGTDVVGTINGQAAIGAGNLLRLIDIGSDPSRGLELRIASGAVGSLGNVEYQPGIAARVVALATAAVGEGGVLTSSAKGYDSRFAAFTTQIQRFEDRLVIREAAYRRQWTSVQTMLSSMQNQQNWLSSQVNSL